MILAWASPFNGVEKLTFSTFMIDNNSLYFTWYGNAFTHKIPEIVNLAAILYMTIRQPKNQTSAWEPG